MGSSSSRRASWALLGLLLAGAASGPALARGGRPAPPALATRESLRERLVYRPRGSDAGLRVAETRRLRATVRVPLTDADRADVSATTLVGVRVGTFSFEAPLSDAIDWSPGRTRATFVELSADAPHRVLTRMTANWAGAGLVVDVRSSDDAPVAGAHRDDDAGGLEVAFDGAARFGDARAHFAAGATGRLRRTAVTVLGSPLDLVRTTLAGQGRIADDTDDGVAPVVSITTPAALATLTAAPVQVTGVLHDDRTIVRVTFAIGTGPEVETTFATDATTGFLDDVAGTFAFAVDPGDGRTTVRVRAYDAAGNAGVGAADFVLTSHGGVVLSAARDHVVVKDAFGRVQQWGFIGGATVATPQLVDGLADVRSVAAGTDGFDGAFTTPTDFSLALLDDGTVRAWGVNGSGELGDGTKTASAAPVTVEGLDHIAQISTSGPFAMALGTDGTVWAWGDNGSGNLGDGSTSQRSTPGPVPGLPKIRFIAAGLGSAYAVDESGFLWVWGGNFTQQLGYSTSLAPVKSPVKLLAVSGVVSVAATGHHIVAVASDGTAWSWGMNAQFGACSQNSTATYLLPGKMLTEEGGMAVGLAGAAAIGYGHSLLVTNGGGVLACNGRTTSIAYGQLGDGTINRHQYLIPLPALAGVRSVSAGWYSSYAVLGDESVMAWGDNTYGQLGDGSGANQFAPVVVTLVP